MLMDQQRAFVTPPKDEATCHLASKQPDSMFAYELAICQTFYFLS